MNNQNLCSFCIRVCNVRNTKPNEPTLECIKFIGKKEKDNQSRLIGE